MDEFPPAMIFPGSGLFEEPLLTDLLNNGLEADENSNGCPVFVLKMSLVDHIEVFDDHSTVHLKNGFVFPY